MFLFCGSINEIELRAMRDSLIVMPLWSLNTVHDSFTERFFMEELKVVLVALKPLLEW